MNLERGPDPDHLQSSTRRAAARRLGASGEQTAAAWYVAHGYEVLDRNWRCASGELDLVCADSSTIVVCEVKTRRTKAFGTPAEAVNSAKRNRIRRLTGRWLSEHDEHRRELRFDVVSIVGDEVTVLKGAF